MQEREKRQAKERELVLVLAERDDLRAQLEETQQSKIRVEDELSRVRNELETSLEQLAKATAAQEALSRSVEDRQQEIDRLAKDMEQIRSERKELGAQLADLKAERETLQQQLTDAEQAKTELESKVMELSNQPTVELDKVLVTGTGPTPAPAAAGGTAMPVSAVSSVPINGQVIVVNREYDFIVMNLGKNHGLSIGQEFQVLRGSEVLGRVKVEKVYDELAAAAILPESQKDNIREGDTVKAL
jgi:ABC-type transporter Mla subunit MlaD